MSIKKIYIALLIVALILLIYTSALIAGCSLLDTGTEADRQAVENSEEGENDGYDSGRLRERDYLVAFLEIGIDEDSMHFEHRVAGIYAVSPDGSGRRLIFTDLNEKYDLGRVYGISPDGSMISCGFFEGGRGAYSSLRVIDVNTGETVTAAEFDYTETESKELEIDISGGPVWSNDSKKIAFETVLNPYLDNKSDGGISIIDIETGDIQDIELKTEENIIGSSTFITPVLFSADDSKLFCVLYNQYPKMEDEEVLGYFSRSEKLLAVDISSGGATAILDIDQFEGGEMSFSDFGLFTQREKLVFQVLGDFEEDGDIWTCSTDGSGLSRLTSDTGLREQQPSILDMPGSIGDLVYVGVERYGTIASNFNSGDVFTISIDGSGQNQVTDYGIGAAAPVYSPCGRYIAFVHYEYDSNMEYVTGYNIEVYSMETGDIETVVSDSGIIDLIGWIPIN
jgi:Tol biopolymer transport system component